MIPKEKLGTMHISTHGIPLSVLITYLEQDVELHHRHRVTPRDMAGPMSNPVKTVATI